MSLSVKKTIYNIFDCRHGRGPSNYTSNIFIDKYLITRFKSAKFLSVINEENVSWKEHTNIIANKINKSLGVLYRKKMLDLYLLCLHYILH